MLLTRNGPFGTLAKANPPSDIVKKPASDASVSISPRVVTILIGPSILPKSLGESCACTMQDPFVSVGRCLSASSLRKPPARATELKVRRQSATGTVIFRYLD